MLLTSYPLPAITIGSNCQEGPGHVGGTSWPLTCAISSSAEASLTPFLRAELWVSPSRAQAHGAFAGKRAKGAGEAGESSWDLSYCQGHPGTGQGQSLLLPCPPRAVSWPCTLHRGLSQALLLFLNLQTFFMRPFLHRFWALHLSCCQSSFKHQHLDERLKNITNYQQKQESQKIFS